MAGERYGEKARAVLAAWLRSNLPAQLDAVEADQSLTAGTMTEPVEYVEYRAPFDNRSPLVEVFVERVQPIHEREGLYAVDCSVVTSYASDADLTGADDFILRYDTAIRKTIRLDHTLGGAVQQAVPDSAEFGVVRGDNSTTRHVSAMGVEVHIHDR